MATLVAFNCTRCESKTYIEKGKKRICGGCGATPKELEAEAVVESTDEAEAESGASDTGE